MTYDEIFQQMLLLQKQKQNLIKACILNFVDVWKHPEYLWLGSHFILNAVQMVPEPLLHQGLGRRLQTEQS